MTPAAASDLLLALVCGLVIWRRRGDRPGIAVAAGLIGLAALLGSVRLSGVDALLGVHRFAALLSAAAGFPLLAFALRWPDDPMAARWSGAGRFALIVGGLGVAITLTLLPAWSQGLTLVATLLILWTMAAARQPAGIAGALALLAGMVATLPGVLPPGTDTTTLLHLGLALGLGLLCLPLPKLKPRSIASPTPRG